MISNKRQILFQAILVLIVAYLSYYCYVNLQIHLQEDHTNFGFEFLHKETRFDIIMHLISYSPSSTYLRAFFVGVLNTFAITFAAIICSSLIGTLIAAASLSKNWLLAKLANAYIAFIMNVPLLLQIFFWYFAQLNYLPKIDNSLEIFTGISLSVRGLQIFDLTIIPEFIAMLLALSLYTSTYIAQEIRLGIKSVDKGQLEAATVSCFSSWQVLRLIILPQALRVFIPPIIHQYLNILKNSALGSAIGYPDLVAVFAGTAMSQSGQALETILMTMLFYIFFSVIVSYTQNILERKLAIIKK